MLSRLFFVLILATAFVSAAEAQVTTGGGAMQLYESLHRFQLAGGTSVHNLVLQRDRGQITFADGTIYFQTPIDGRVYGGVFIGTGKFHADAPPLKFEQDNIRRLIHADNVDSDFKTAVLRFTDDTYEILGKGSVTSGAAPDAAAKFVEKYDARMAYETGANISARLAESILNRESLGFFIAEFDNGRLGRFSFVFDAQTRIPSEVFGVNGGEKGLIFQYQPLLGANDDWMAFYAKENYPEVHREFPDAYDQVKIRNHDMEFDLRNPQNTVRYKDRITMEVQQGGLRAVQFSINRDLIAAQIYAYQYAMHLTSAETEDGKPLAAIQGVNDKTVVVFLPAAAKQGQQITIQLGFERVVKNFYGEFVPSSRSWHPSHGYRQRATYHAKFIHGKRYVTLGLGKQISESPWSGDTSYLITEWNTEAPVASYSFVLKDKQRDDYKQSDSEVKTVDGAIPVSLYEYRPARTKFVQGEIENTLQYFDELYGRYPYPTLRADFGMPTNGEAFATMAILPNSDIADRSTFFEFGRVMAMEWWGNNITARSYRDQWMVDGLRDYSALLYERHRHGNENFRFILTAEREQLAFAPAKVGGVAPGRMAELGPIILGQRLRTRESTGAFEGLVIEKGTLVIRMLDFLFTDPATQDDKAFSEMLKELEKAHSGDAASTEDLIAVANKNFANTAIARQYNLKDLSWFFDQWVYTAGFPSYRLEYHVEAQPDGSAMVKGNLFQEGLAEDAKWFMPLPVTVSFGKGKVEHYTVAVTGPQTEVSFKISAIPEKVELDPELFVISSKTSTQKVR